MSTPDRTDQTFVELIDEPVIELLPLNGDASLNAPSPLAQAPVTFSLEVEPGTEKRYSINDLQKLSAYLNRESSSRYRAVVLNTWTGSFDTSHYEVGLVQVRNGDHRNGVVHALGVSPFNVKFIQLEDAFFEYLYSHI